MPVYTIASQEGADKYGREIGEALELHLTAEEQLALTAAGWLEEGGTLPPEPEPEPEPESEPELEPAADAASTHEEDEV